MKFLKRQFAIMIFISLADELFPLLISQSGFSKLKFQLLDGYKIIFISIERMKKWLLILSCQKFLQITCCLNKLIQFNFSIFIFINFLKNISCLLSCLIFGFSFLQIIREFTLCNFTIFICIYGRKRQCQPFFFCLINVFLNH